MLEPRRNPASWDNFRKAAVLVLIILAAALVLFGVIYFFILGAAALRRWIYSGRLFCLSPLSLGRLPDWLKFKNRKHGRRRGSGGGVGEAIKRCGSFAVSARRVRCRNGFN